MVAKGHHFPGVDLAAVVDADTGLAIPDFRAEERTFQLVTQLAGRSGRDAPGLVLVQTFQPDAMPFAVRRSGTTSRGSSPRSWSDARRSATRRSPSRHGRRLGPRRRGRRPGAARGAAGLEGVEGTLLGPAPLLRLRGRHRAQLVAKTDEPRALARRAAALLAAASPELRGAA